MSFEINPREVLKHLNEIGYRDISAIQLREFIRDLKMLIKYDHKYKNYSTNQENIHPESYYYCNDPISSTDKEATEYPPISQEFYSTIRGTKNNKTKESHRLALRQENVLNHQRITNNFSSAQSQYHSTHRLHPTSTKADYDEYNTRFNNDSCEDSTKTPYYSNIFTYNNSSNFDDVQQTNSHAYKSKPNYSSYSVQPNVCDVGYDEFDSNDRREEYLSKVFNNLYCHSTASSRAKSKLPQTHLQKFHQRDLLGRDEGDFKKKTNLPHSSSNAKNINDDILTLYDVQRLKSGLSSATADISHKSVAETDHLKYNSKQSSKIKSMVAGSGSIQSEPAKHNQNQRLRSKLIEVQGIMGSGDIRFEPKTNKHNENTEADGESVKSQPTNRSEKNTRSRPKSSDYAEIRPKVSFIRPRQPVRTSKSDPVTLYHQYQEEWKKIKLPGEDKRFNLRWAIRERMLAAPEIDYRSRCPSTSKRSVSMKSLN